MKEDGAFDKNNNYLFLVSVNISNVYMKIQQYEKSIKELEIVKSPSLKKDWPNLYATIIDYAGMKIVNQFKRPVLNRTERDKSPYSEIIFHLRTNQGKKKIMIWNFCMIYSSGLLSADLSEQDLDILFFII